MNSTYGYINPNETKFSIDLVTRVITFNYKNSKKEYFDLLSELPLEIQWEIMSMLKEDKLEIMEVYDSNYYYTIVTNSNLPFEFEAE